MNIPKERIIYSNYDTFKDLSEAAKENLRINEGIENPTIDEILYEVSSLDEINWADEKERLKEFFNGGDWILFGSVGRWNGNFSAGCIFHDFMEMFYTATKDCDYVKIYDENGHFYIKCSHHDGTNFFEIKEVSDNGMKYLERWENNWGDKRSEGYVHNMIAKRYSKLPHFANRVYGCPLVEYERKTA